MVEGQDLVRLERYAPDRILDFNLSRDIVKKGILSGGGDPSGSVEDAEIGTLHVSRCADIGYQQQDVPGDLKGYSQSKEDRAEAGAGHLVNVFRICRLNTRR